MFYYTKSAKIKIIKILKNETQKKVAKLSIEEVVEEISSDTYSSKDLKRLNKLIKIMKNIKDRRMKINYLNIKIHEYRMSYLQNKLNRDEERLRRTIWQNNNEQI